MGAVISNPNKNKTDMYGASYGSGQQHRETLLGFKTLDDAKKYLSSKGYEEALYLTSSGSTRIPLKNKLSTWAKC